MSWAFISALKQNPQQSYVQLLNSIRDILQTKYTQKPQLSCSHPLGMSTTVHRISQHMHVQEANMSDIDVNLLFIM